MAQKGAEAVDVLDIDTLMNSPVDDKDAGTVVSSRSMNTLSLKQDLGAGGTMPPVQNATVAHNGGEGPLMEVVDLTIPVKTTGEASTSVSTAVSVNNVATGLASVRATSQAAPPVASSPLDGLTNTITGMGAFGVSSQLWSLGSQLQLSPEEQASAYKKANIVALSALAKKGGPNVKEMLAVQAKLQEFLTSLIALAGKTGPQLKLTVQGLVQKLVTGAITVEEFASRIESDLRSQHQPSLLPFLKNSVPHLRARLQLQQAIMKELLQRMVQEKKQQPPLGQQTQQRPQIQQTQQLQMQQTRQQPSQVQQTQQQQPQVQQQQPQVQQTQQQSQVQQKQQQPPQMQQTQQQVVQQSTHQQQIVQQQLAIQSVQQAAQQLSQRSEGQPTKTTTTVPSQQQMLSEPVKIPQSQQQQPPQVSQLPKPPVAVPTNSKSPSPQLLASQVILKEQLARLTPEQQKFLVMHEFRRQQMMMKNISSMTTQPSTQLASRGLQNFQAVMEKQQQLVKEQQVPLVMGGTGKPPNQLPATQGGHVNQTSSQLVASSTGNLTQTTNKTSFANMKLSTFAPSGSGSDQSAVKGKGKSRGENNKGKQSPVLQEDEEEEERMDTSIAGINLQEETAHFLPQTTGEMVSRTCRDKVLLDTSQLRQRVASIARLYGITNVSEDYLVMLSHATQERLEDIMGKLTMVSHHRMEILKDDRQYEATSEVRGQLKILETIDRINHKRKQEREKEKILRAAKSRSKAEDPETAAKIKEQAKQLQQEEEQKIRNKAANLTALAAIGRRKRPATALQQPDNASAGTLSSLGGADAGQGTSLPGSLSVTRQHKRRITTRDLVFYMEQERETKKSLLLYKSLLK